MAKFHGNVGFVENKKTGKGVWEDVVTELPYFGDVLRDSISIENNASLNSGFTVNNMFSLLADDYAMLHFSAIRYLRWGGVAWEVTSVEAKTPRLILRVGGVYHGATA